MYYVYPMYIYMYIVYIYIVHACDVQCTFFEYTQDMRLYRYKSKMYVPCMYIGCTNGYIMDLLEIYGALLLNIHMTCNEHLSDAFSYIIRIYTI